MLTTDSFWRQGVGFLEGRGPWYVDQTPEDDTTPKSIWVHKLDLIGFVKQTERGHKAGWVEGEGLWEDLCKWQWIQAKYMLENYRRFVLIRQSAKVVSKSPCYGKATTLQTHFSCRQRTHSHFPKTLTTVAADQQKLKAPLLDPQVEEDVVSAMWCDSDLVTRTSLWKSYPSCPGTSLYVGVRSCFCYFKQN